MSKVDVENSSLLADKYKTDLGSLDFFDKVINLKIITKDKESGEVKNTYVIRSDFEVFYPGMQKAVTMGDMDTFSSLGSRKLVYTKNGGGFDNSKTIGYIRKCTYKPSVKVQYKRVSLTSDIEIDIFVKNFYALSQNGELVQNFQNDNNPLSTVVVSMGYFGQFQEMFKKANAEGLPQSGKEFMEYGFREEDKAFGITSMVCDNVGFTSIEKLPPDSVLHIYAFVGNVHSPGTMETTRPVTYDELKQSKVIVKFKEGASGSFLSDFYFQYITSFYTKESSYDAETAFKISASRDVSGAFSESVAKEYGIPVYMSKGMQEYSKEYKKTKLARDKNGNVILPSITFPSVYSDTAEARMCQIEKDLSLKGITHTYLDGIKAYFVYKTEEMNDIAEMLSGVAVNAELNKTGFHKYWNSSLPAVYGIDKGALVTINCPFFGFINPFELVKFKSRYALSGIVQYFSGMQSGVMAFLVLKQSVSFATLEDVNDCMLLCASTKGEAEKLIKQREAELKKGGK